MSRILMVAVLFLCVGAGSFVPTMQPVRAAEEEGDTDQAVLRALGASSAGFMFQTQLSVGLVADAHANKVYDKKTCSQLLQISLNLLGAITSELDKLMESDLEETEKAGIESLKNIAEALNKETSELQDFVESGEESHKEQYLEHRKEAQKLLDALGKGEEKDDNNKNEKNEK